MGMKRLSLVLSLLVAPISFAQDDSASRYESTVLCEVRGVSIVGVKEGEHVSYSGMNELPEKGDQMRFTYEVNASDSSRSARVSLKSRTEDGDKSLLYALIIGIGEGENVVRQSDSSITLEEGDREIVGSVANTVAARSSVSELWLTRYYKADWQGIYSTSRLPGNYVYVATLRCQQSEDRLSAFVERAIEVFATD